MSPLLYRVFLLPLTAFFMFMVVFCQPSPILAQSGDQFAVENIKVDIEADSALDARNKAFAQARRDAYRTVVARLNGDDAKEITLPDDRILASLVKDFEIIEEKMTSKRYAGTMNFRLSSTAVRRTIQNMEMADGSGVYAEDPTKMDPPVITGSIVSNHDDTYTPTAGHRMPLNDETMASAKARSVLVLPWYGPTGRQTIWGQTNPWRAAWEENIGLSRDRVMPVLLPIGDVEDLRDYSPPQPLSRRGDVHALMNRYGASEVVVALAEPAKVGQLPGQLPGQLIVSLYRFEAGTPVALGRFGIDASDPDMYATAVTRVVSSLRALSPSQKNTASPIPASVTQYVAPATSNSYHAVARFSGLQQWMAMRESLSRAQGVSNVNIVSISPAQAQIKFDYRGDVRYMAQSLAQGGLSLSALQPGTVPASPGAAAPRYQLTLTRSY